MAISESAPARTERRRYPRLNRNIRLALQHRDRHGYDIKGETQNLSLLGAYCQVDKPVPEMTQLMILLDLPHNPIKCEGTVVRAESGSKDSGLHHLAIYFHEISDEAKSSLAKFLEG